MREVSETERESQLFWRMACDLRIAAKSSGKDRDAKVAALLGEIEDTMVLTDNEVIRARCAKLMAEHQSPVMPYRHGKRAND